MCCYWWRYQKERHLLAQLKPKQEHRKWESGCRGFCICWWEVFPKAKGCVSGKRSFPFPTWKRYRCCIGTSHHRPLSCTTFTKILRLMLDFGACTIHDDFLKTGCYDTKWGLPPLNKPRWVFMGSSTSLFFKQVIKTEIKIRGQKAPNTIGMWCFLLVRPTSLHSGGSHLHPPAKLRKVRAMATVHSWESKGALFFSVLSFISFLNFFFCMWGEGVF